MISVRSVALQGLIATGALAIAVQGFNVVTIEPPIQPEIPSVGGGGGGGTSSGRRVSLYDDLDGKILKVSIKDGEQYLASVYDSCMAKSGVTANAILRRYAEDKIYSTIRARAISSARAIAIDKNRTIAATKALAAKICDLQDKAFADETANAIFAKDYSATFNALGVDRETLAILAAQLSGKLVCPTTEKALLSVIRQAKASLSIVEKELADAEYEVVISEEDMNMLIIIAEMMEENS